MRLVALFPECRNIELVKDICQIPYILGSEHQDIETAIVVSNRLDMNGINFQYVKGLSFIHTPMLFNNKDISGAWYLVNHAKEIDWLTIYHCGRASFYEAMIYKRLNPKGKVYLKLDMDLCSCEKFDNDKWERKLFQKNVDLVDLITVETQLVKDRIQKYASKEIYVVTDGYCKALREPNILREREDAFVTVGRLGTKQKATEVLMEAFAKSSAKHTWSLKLIGSIENEFNSVIDSFFERNPELKSRVTFLGEIAGREDLYNEYSKVKVFVLPSRWESFGIVGAEALACGCKLILTDQVAPYKEMTNYGKYGQIVTADDIDALAEAMVLMTKQDYSSMVSCELSKYANEKFSWSVLCNQLYRLLMEHNG